jgi:hypothetical protein
MADADFPLNIDRRRLLVSAAASLHPHKFSYRSHPNGVCWRRLITRPRRVMPNYKFKRGQIVVLGRSLGLNIPGGSYTVVKRMPLRDGDFEYRVRSTNEPYERVVRESQLRNVGN